MNKLKILIAVFIVQLYNINIAFSQCSTPLLTGGTFYPGASSVTLTSSVSGTSYVWVNTSSGQISNSSVYSGATTNQLTIANPGNLIGKSFMVVVMYPGCTGATSNTVTLAYIPAPTITLQPSGSATNVGCSASFSVSATNAVSYQWYTSITGGGIVPASMPWSGSTTRTLSISTASTGVAGTYWVKITNGSGTITSNVVTLTVATITPRAVSANMNYIQSRTILKDNVLAECNIESLSADELQETVTYFDGLGRPRQNVSWQASPAKYDIVVPVAYDVFGREDKKYLPYALSSNNNGAFVSTDLAGQSAYYSTIYGADGSNAFAQTIFEASPLNRKLKQGAPGSTWQPNVTPASDHSVKYDEGTNSTTDNVRMWTVSSVGTPTSTAYYPANSLYKTTTWDENNPNDLATTTSRTEEFKNLQGKVVLKRSYKGSAIGTDTLSTYYVYDDLELMRVVIPPLANTYGGNVTSVLNDLCYQYTYDARKRMTIKKLPGADPVYLVYDLRDRLVAVQDGVQRGKNPDEWTFTKYDALNRPIMTGIYNVADGTPQATVQATVSGFSIYSENRLTTGYGYTNNSFPTNITDSDILSLTYYDTYGYPGAKTFDNSVRVSDYYNSATGYYYFDKIKGLVTGAKVKVLDGTENNASGFRWLLSTNYYDDHYRAIQTVRDLFATDATYYEATSVLYDFTGKAIQTKQAQTFNSVTTTVDKYLTYDQAGRLTKTEQQIAGDANGKVTVAQNIYNETGQLIDKKLHQAGSYDYLQSVDYTYNIRGWLTSINNPDNLSGDLFGERLLYESTESGLNSQQFNGNISAMVWNSTQKSKQGYGFTYDGLNRLTLGDHKDYTSAWTDNNNYEEKSLAYDKNGNINRLIRTNSTGSNIADFTYAYNGNKLSSINGGTAYNYDLNGNTTLDGLRGVAVAYNILNLPKLVSKGSDIITYIYSAAGEKLAKRMKDGTYQYYAGNMVYKNDKSLNYLSFDEGLVNKVSGGYAYEYHLKDHLGNTRVTFQPNGSTTTTTQVAEYYPFGSSYLPISPAGTNKYLYNGKEKQDDVLSGTALDWYDYGARFYDPVIGRWHTPDPKAEQYYSCSIYHFTANNPMNLIDPDGQSYYYLADGTFLLQTNDKKDDVLYWNKNKENQRQNDNGESETYYGGFDALQHNGKTVQNGDLTLLASTAYGESSTQNNKDEVYGISNATVNNMDLRKNGTIKGTINGFAFAATDGNKRTSQFNKTSANDRNCTFMQTALGGAINALSGGLDYSNGATHWAGSDIGSSSEKRATGGLLFSERSHDLFSLGSATANGAPVNGYNRDGSFRGTYSYTWQTTAAYGGTTFMKKTDKFIIATGAPRY